MRAVTALLAALTGLASAWWFIGGPSFADTSFPFRGSSLPEYSECFPFRGVPKQTTCPMDDDWVWRLRLATAHVDRDTVFLDVGCNTGVDAAKWLDVWGHSARSPQRMALTSPQPPGRQWRLQAEREG